jgi:ATP-dependent DNA helicase RecG
MAPVAGRIGRGHRDPGTRSARRLAYDEVFANQLALLLLRQASRRHRGVSLAGDGRLIGKLSLPYQLTELSEGHRRDSRRHGADAPMLRLLQGDVGSGKTLVALMAMLTAIESGAQAALLGPRRSSPASTMQRC